MANQKPQQKKTIKSKKEAHNAPAIKTLKKQNDALKMTGLQLALIAAALGFVLYIMTIGYKYAYDDFSVMKENWVVQKGFSGIGTILHTGYRYGYWSVNDELYRPLSLITFAIEWQLFPNSPGVSHFINVLLFALTGFLLFRFLSKLFPKNFNIPFIATLLFMAHPVHTEAIANIKSRDEILCLLLSVLSLSLLLDYVKTKKKVFILSASIVYFLAVLSKETAITLIAIVPIMLFIFTNLNRQKIFTYTLPFLGGGIAYLIIRFAVIHTAANGAGFSMLDNVIGSAPDIFSRFATAMYVLLRYLWLLIFPNHLSYDYSYPEIRIHKLLDYKVIAALLIYSGLAVFAVIKLIKKDKIAFGILFFLITLAILSNVFIVIGTVMADRLLYMPSVGFCIAIAVLMNKYIKSPAASAEAVTANGGIMAYAKNNRNILLLTIAIVALYSFKTIQRNPVWENDMTLYQSGLIDAPNSSKTHYLLGLELKNKYVNEDKDSVTKAKDLNEGQKELEIATKLFPNNSQAYRELGTVFLQRKDLSEAMKNFDKAIALTPTDNISLNNKGVVYARQGDIKNAMAMVKESVKYNPRYVDGLRNIGVCYSIQKNMDSAIIYYNEALKYNPVDVQTLNYLASLYKDKGDAAMSAQYEAAAKKALAEKQK